ncbi:MAG TPA: S8 family serine peptidase, partial [Usitatibacter sp.]|nr:S8 family serine peptidase [Usitatibacter sp.]
MDAGRERAMKRDGFLTLTLRPGIDTAIVPAHLDCLSGAGRPASRLDGGRIDALVMRYADGARFRRIFHAAQSLGRPGEHHVGYDDEEEALGMSRSYQVELARSEADTSVREALRDLAHVEHCEVQSLATAPLDVRAARRIVSRDDALQAQHRIRAPEAMMREPGDPTVAVAVVDTGVVVGHPELQQRCLAGYDTVDLGLGRINDTTRLIGDSRGWDYNPYDEVGHGCLVAGIIGARGFRVPRGLCGHAMLLPIRVLAAARRDAAPSRLVGVGALPDIDEGLKVAVDLGAHVINMSLGSARDSDDPHALPPHQAVARYAARRGCLMVAAAGNSGRREEFYPAALPEVIAVGSVDGEGQRSRFSSWGPQLAVCAPGEGIVGVARRGYQVSSGTSFASPYVAGAVAMLVAHARR